MLEAVIAIEAMQHGGHPPGEALALPDAAQADLAIAVEQVGLAALEELLEPTCQHADIGDGEVHALRPGGGHDMRGVAGKKKPAMAHRLHHEAAHGGDALLENGPFLQFIAAAETLVQFLPDARIGPFIEVLVRRALQVEPADRLAAHGREREAVLVPRIDQLMRDGPGMAQDAKPGEGVDAVINAQDVVRDRAAADAVEAVAAADEGAVQHLRHAVMGEADLRVVAGHVMHGDVRHVEQDRRIGPARAGGQPRGDEILHHLLLAVDGHDLAGEIGERNAMAHAVEAQLDAMMREALRVQAVRHPRLGQRIDAALFQQPRAHALLDIAARARLQHHGLDARQMQQMRQQQPRRTRADDADLGAHEFPP